MKSTGRQGLIDSWYLIPSKISTLRYADSVWETYLECDLFRRIPVYFRNEQPRRPLGVDQLWPMTPYLSMLAHVDDNVRVSGKIKIHFFIQAQIGFTQSSRDDLKSKGIELEFAVFQSSLDPVGSHSIIGSSDQTHDFFDDIGRQRSQSIQEMGAQRAGCACQNL